MNRKPAMPYRRRRLRRAAESPGATSSLRHYWRALSTAQLFVASFLLLILLGTLGYRWLPNLYTGEPLGWLDALFTATSAVCVTGLIVVDTAAAFTRWGQAYTLLLIQLGGLGMIAFTTLIIMAIGRRLSLRHEALSSGGSELAPEIDHRRLARSIMAFTFGAEFVAAVLLFLVWLPRFAPADAAWHALFHAISAFCNAGFSTFSDSLVGFQTAPLTQFLIMGLIVLGGIGFLTLEEVHLLYLARRRGRAFRLSIHSRLVLATTAALLLGGWMLFAVLEWANLFALLGPLDSIVNALFMSTTARTAGFNTVDYAAATDGSGFLTIILMSIGGSPGSTAGGMKTTTFALIGLLAWTRFRGRDVPWIWHRSIPVSTIYRAVGVFVLGFTLVTGGIFVLSATERSVLGTVAAGDPFLVYMFEAVSAFNTVGLSMGVTADLSTPGRLLTIALMYLGRVGPLTFAAAISLPRPMTRRSMRYAYEDVVVG